MTNTVKVEFVYEFTEEWVAKCGVEPSEWRAMDPATRARWMTEVAMEWIEENGEPTSVIVEMGGA